MNDFSSAGFSQRPQAFSAPECRDLAVVLTSPQLEQENRLSEAFDGTTGLQVIFTREGIHELQTGLPFLTRFFQVASADRSNAFFMNALIIRGDVHIHPHLDCSLNTFLIHHVIPTRVSVLYVQVPIDLSGGSLQLFDHPGAVTTIPPVEGLLVQFRGDIVHSVSRGSTKGQRISLVLEEYELAERDLSFVPPFSMQPALRRANVSKEYPDAYKKIRDFVLSLSADERSQLLAKNPNQEVGIDSNSKDL